MKTTTKTALASASALAAATLLFTLGPKAEPACLAEDNTEVPCDYWDQPQGENHPPLTDSEIYTIELDESSFSSQWFEHCTTYDTCADQLDYIEFSLGFGHGK